MRERLRVLVAACFYYTGLIKLALWLMQRSKRRLIILNYHRAGGNLRSQLHYLRRHYRIMHLEEALEEFYSSTCNAQPRKRKRDHRIPLVVTFDDGYMDNYTELLPLAQKLQVPMTIFVIPGYVESGEYFWWLAARRIARSVSTDEVTFMGEHFCLKQPGGREALRKCIDTYIRYAPSVVEREARLAEVQQALGVALPRRVTGTLNDSALPLSWSHIREMEESGWVSFGAHTVHHPILAYLSDGAEVQREVEEARMVLEEKLGHPVRVFAYPVGKLQHIGGTALHAVKDAGYKWALTTLEDENREGTNPYLLRRFPGDENVHWLVMAAELVGLLGVVSRVRKKYAKLFRRK